MRKNNSVMIFLIIILVLLGGCNKTVKVNNSTENSINTYLSTNYNVINLDKQDSFSDLSIIDGDLKNKEIFFTGENHGIKANKKLNMKFLKYFKKKTNFKYYLCELPYSDTYFLNKYLISGDTKILEKIYKPLKGTFEWNKDNYNHWKELYEFNKKLPENQKIQVVGIDIEHQSINALAYMNEVVDNNEMPKEIDNTLKGIKKLYNKYSKENVVNEIELKEFCKTLKKNIEENENIYKQYLKKEFLGFKLVNDNILYKYEAYDAKNNDFNKVRDKRIYENFKNIYSELPKGKYYGQWGLNHVYQKEQDNVKWVAAAMNEEGSVLKDKILSIIYVYDNCKYMSKNIDRTYSIGEAYSYDSWNNIFKDFIKENYTMFRLTGKESPFKNKMIWPINSNWTGEIPKGSTTDFFQYIVVIRKSQATEPLNDEY